MVVVAAAATRPALTPVRHRERTAGASLVMVSDWGSRVAVIGTPRGWGAGGSGPHRRDERGRPRSTGVAKKDLQPYGAAPQAERAHCGVVNERKRGRWLGGIAVAAAAA